MTPRGRNQLFKVFFRGGGDEVVPTLHLMDWLEREGWSD